MSNGVYAFLSELPISGFLEISLPAENLESSTKFYQSLGYSVISSEPWGMVSLKREDESRVTLFSKKFFKNIALSFTTRDLGHLKSILAKNSIQILEDDSESTPARIVISDPSGTEIMIFQQ